MTHCGKIVVALKETIRLMAEIDAVIPSWPIECAEGVVGVAEEAGAIGVHEVDLSVSVAV